MKSLVWALIPYVQCPYKMGTFGPRDMYVGIPHEDESRDQYEVSTSQGTPKISSKPSQNRVIEWILSHSPQKHQLCRYLDFRFLASKIVGVLSNACGALLRTATSTPLI